MSSVGWISSGLLWIVVAAQTIMIVGLARAVYRLERRSDLPNGRGEVAPTFVGSDIDGEEVASGAYIGRSHALLFVSPNCAGCTVTMEELAALRTKSDAILIVCRGSTGECRSLVIEHGLTVPVIVDGEFKISDDYGITATPTAVLISADGRITSTGNPLRGEEFDAVLNSVATLG